MALADVIQERIRMSMSLYDELVAELPEDALERKLPAIRSNHLGGQLWCVIGARESYARAIATGKWQGFSCSLTGPGSVVKNEVGAALARSNAAVCAALEPMSSQSDAQLRFVVQLLEHEAAHHGQIIRYLYGLGLSIPPGWKSRYALE